MRMLAQLTVPVALALFTTVVSAQPLPRAEPEAVGLSGERLERIGRALRAEIEKGKFPGAVALVARKGRIAYYESFGVRDPATGAPMAKDAIFRIYSMTKPMTSVAVMMLQEEGRLVLTDPVSKHLPQLAKLQVGVEHVDPATGKTTFYTMPAEREMTIQDLLRHTSGFTYGVFGKSAVKDLYTRRASTRACRAMKRWSPSSPRSRSITSRGRRGSTAARRMSSGASSR